VPWRWTVEVRLDVPVEDARRRISGTLARTAEAPGGGTLLSLRAGSLDWVASTLAALGCDFAVLAPREELRAALDRLAARLQRA